MLDSKVILRDQFYSLTNIEISNKTRNWKRYALWLEQQCGYKISNDIKTENKLLESKLDRIRNITEY
jgi:hypothetical protein